MSAEQPVAEVTDPRLDDLLAEIKAHLGDVVTNSEILHNQVVIRVPADKRPEALSVLKILGFTYYSWAGGVDWPDEDKLEVFDHVESVASGVPDPGPWVGLQCTVKCEVPRSDPRVPTAINVYGGADWHEREAWELYGIVFHGHPRLRRLLLADWQEGFPMRKDEVLRPRVEKPWPGEFFSG